MRENDRTKPYRNIARALLEQVYDENLEEEADLVRSLVRQLTTNDGHAALLTEKGQFWIKVVEKGKDGWEVGINHVPECRIYDYVLSWDFDEKLIPYIVRRMSVAQSAEFTNRKGMKLRMWVEPKESRIAIEPVADADDPAE